MIKFEEVGSWIEQAREVCEYRAYILERNSYINTLWGVTTAGSSWCNAPKWWY